MGNFDKKKIEGCRDNGRSAHGIPLQHEIEKADQNNKPIQLGLQLWHESWWRDKQITNSRAAFARSLKIIFSHSFQQASI
jgi:hypothetical protein